MYPENYGIYDIPTVYNEQSRGVYFFVNLGGHEDDRIDRINAQFMECDNLLLEESSSISPSSTGRLVRPRLEAVNGTRWHAKVGYPWVEASDFPKLSVLQDGAHPSRSQQVKGGE